MGKKIELKINYITVKLWDGQEFRVYIGDIDASIEGILERFLEIYPKFTQDDIQGILVRF